MVLLQCVALALSISLSVADPKPPTPAAPYPSPPGFSNPTPWTGPDTSGLTNADAIIAKHKNILGICTASQAAASWNKKAAVGTATLLTSLIPYVGGPTSTIVGTVMDIFMGEGNCYMDKFEGYMREFVTTSISAGYIDVLRKDLAGFKLRIDNMLPTLKLKTLLDLRDDMIGKEPHFLETSSTNKRMSIIPARDYLNMRLALFQDLIPIDDASHTYDHWQDMAQLIVKSVKHIEQAIELVGQEMRSRIDGCKRDGDGIKPGCYPFRTSGGRINPPTSGCVCHGNRYYDDRCKDFWVYYVPGLNGDNNCGHSGYKWLDKNAAQSRGYKEVTSKMSAGIPWSDWRQLRDHACSHISGESACSYAIYNKFTF